MKTKTILLTAVVGLAAVAANAGVHWNISVSLPFPVVVTAPVVVAMPPPPPPAPPVIVETVPPCPSVEFVWVPGGWSYRPTGYVWVQGNWCHRPAGYEHHDYAHHEHYEHRQVGYGRHW